MHFLSGVAISAQSKRSALGRARKFLKEAEIVISDIRQVDAFFNSVFHWLVGTPWFLMRGLVVLLMPLGIAFTIAFGVVAFLKYGEASTSPQNDQIAWYFGMIIGAGLVAFNVPSRSSTTGVKDKQVQILAESLRSMSVAEVSTLQASCNLFKASVEERIRRLNWMLGILWAGITWYGTNLVLRPEIPEVERNHGASVVFAYLVIFAFSGVVLLSYSAACRILFQTIAFAFIETSVDTESS
ncbi:MAG: hypothetical protein ACREPQ_16375 [Rhodanobacter sp.]